MDALAALEQAQRREWRNEDGELLEPEFLPGLAEEDLKGIASQIEASLPKDFVNLARACGGISGIGIEVDFAGFGESWAAPFMPRGWPFAHDGCGNYWVLDVPVAESDEAVIFYASHDAPVLLFQGRGMAEFLNQLHLFDLGDRTSDIWNVFSDDRFNVWQTNPGTIRQPDALLSSDVVIREFAETLEENFEIIDLRNVPPAMGFSWGRRGYGESLRWGDERIFAYAKQKKQGLLSRLLGRASVKA